METNDRRVWMSTKNGQYIVLSGCTVEQTRREQARVMKNLAIKCGGGRQDVEEGLEFEYKIENQAFPLEGL